jgi:hypothetical protein
MAVEKNILNNIGIENIIRKLFFINKKKKLCSYIFFKYNILLYFSKVLKFVILFSNND